MAGRQLKDLFRAFRSGDELTFRRAALEIIEDEEAKHHLALARDLKAILASGSVVESLEPAMLPAPPTDRDGSFPLAEVREPTRFFSDLVLTGTVEEHLMELIAEVRNWTELDAHGVPRRQRVLFFGPPGTGKTSAAEAVAAEIERPMLSTRLDSVVSSYLGETATNLRRIFDHIKVGNYVVLFDEFDALGKSRDDPSEHGEIKRVINAFLQMLDSVSGNNLIIAATNHEHLLDTAVWRRFDDVVRFDTPTVAQIRRLLYLRLRPMPTRGVNLGKVASELRGMPHAGIERVAWDAMRLAIIAGRSTVLSSDVQKAIKAAKSRPW